MQLRKSATTRRRAMARRVRQEAARFSSQDVVAGVSVGMLLIPQSMAYAELAGLPAHVGLYAAGLPPVLAAFFASSPYLQTGPVALTALLTLGALLPLAPRATPEYVALAVLLALVVGVTRILVGVLRLGGVANLMSQPVLMGFTSAAAILIVASQVPSALGVTGLPQAGVLGSAAWALTHPASWETASLVLTPLAVAASLAGRRIHPLLPGVFLAALGGVAWSALSGYVGPVVGDVPRGYPIPSLDLPWRGLPALVLPGVVIAFVGFAEVASISRTFATQDRRPWSPDREFISQGVANLASGISGGFPVGGSFSRSSINRLAGARTQWSGAVTGLTVLVFLPFAWVLAPLPRAVLAAIVLAAVVPLVKIWPLAALWRTSRLQAGVGATTFALTLFLAPRVDQAILLGVVMALAIHAWREMQPRLETWTDGDTFHVRPEGVLWFGSAPILEERLLAILSRPTLPPKLALHLGSLGRIDLTGALVLKRLVEDARVAGVEIRLADVPTHAERILGKVMGWSRDAVDARGHPSEARRIPLTSAGGGA